jgi:hypothetical protein
MATNAQLRLMSGDTVIDMYNPESMCIAIDGSKSSIMPLDDSNKIMEQWTFHIKADGANGLAKQVQRLKKLANQANEFSYSSLWGNQVHLHQQGDCEENERIALVRQIRDIDFPSAMEHPGRAGLLVGVQMSILREHPWRTKEPGVHGVEENEDDAVLHGRPGIDLAPSDGPSSPDPILVHVANFRDTFDLTHIYHRDDSAAAWSGNLIAAANGTALLPAAPAINDYHLMGSTAGPFKHACYGITTGSVHSANLQLQYWSGAAYTPMTLGVEYTLQRVDDGESLNDNGIFRVPGGGFFVFNFFPHLMPGWAAHNDGPGPSNAYWIRVFLVAVTSWTTVPTKNADTIYAQRKNYVEVPAASIKGDTYPLACIRGWSPSGADEDPTNASISRVLIGAKSDSEDGIVNLDDFEPMLNAGNAGNPGVWAATYGLDTSAVADIGYPGAVKARTTFATDATLQVRVMFTGTAIAPAYRGDYRVLVGVQQIGGIAEDITISGRIFVGEELDDDPHADLREAIMLSHDLGIEVVDLGLIQIPRSRSYRADPLAGINVGIHLLAERTGAAGPVLDWAWVFLLPVLEGSVGADDPVTDAIRGSSALRGGSFLEIDNGCVANRTVKFQHHGNNTIALAEEWGRFDKPIEFRNLAQRTRLYFLMLHYTSEGWGVEPLIASLGPQLTVEIFMHYRYLFLRGED